jgi:hypothetical protein
MSPRVCVCCGESMPEQGNALSRNPNVCASCSSMADGMEHSSLHANTPLTVNSGLSSSEPVADEANAAVASYLPARR